MSDGPWKLHGLPGLILEAHDAEDEFHFTCIEIKLLSKAKAIALPEQKYIRCTKEKMIGLLNMLENNPNDYLKLKGVGPITVLERDGTQSTNIMPGTKFNYIER